MSAARPPRTLPVAAAVFALGVVAVVAAGTGARWDISDRFHLFSSRPTYVPPPQPTRIVTPAARPPTGTPDNADWLLPVLWALLVVAVLVAAFVVWRVLPRRPQKNRHALGAGSDVLGQPGDPSVPVLQEGFGMAQHLLDTVADPTDAVLAAWVALEQAAGRSGVPRRPADTPTEFTVEVLTATPADRYAVTTLLGLYHQARFSGRGVGPDAVVEARRCLDALAASWTAFSVSVSRP